MGITTKDIEQSHPLPKSLKLENYLGEQKENRQAFFQHFGVLPSLPMESLENVDMNAS